MALFNNLDGACEAQLRYLSEFQGTNYGFNLGNKIGGLEFLASDYNLGYINATRLELQDQTTGKLKKARVTYSQRPLSTVARTGAPAIAATICDPGTEFEEQTVDVPITNAAATRVLKFTNAQLIEMCENPTQYMNRYFFSELRAAREAMDKVILAKLDTASGVIVGHDGVTVAKGTNKSLKLISIGANGERVPLFSTYNQIKLDYNNMNMNGSPAIIGQGLLTEFFDLSGYACCNSSTPFMDAVSRANAAYFEDQFANAIFGTNEFAVVAPGSVMLLTVNENRAIKMNTELVKHYVMPDPVIPGLSWDVDFKWDECEKAYLWMAKVHFDVWGTYQTDSFAVGDPLAGVTGIFKYIATAS